MAQGKGPVFSGHAAYDKEAVREKEVRVAPLSGFATDGPAARSLLRYTHSKMTLPATPVVIPRNSPMNLSSSAGSLLR
jgi:hypothetical protein